MALQSPPGRAARGKVARLRFQCSNPFNGRIIRMFTGVPPVALLRSKSGTLARKMAQVGPGPLHGAGRRSGTDLPRTGRGGAEDRTAPAGPGIRPPARGSTAATP